MMTAGLNRGSVEARHRLKLIEDQLVQVRTTGFCLCRDIVWPGVSGIAAPIPSRAGRPYLAVALTAVNERLPDERAKSLAPLLTAAAHEISHYCV